MEKIKSLAINFKKRNNLGDPCVDGGVIQRHYFI
jgi:hypothetical protein